MAIPITNFAKVIGSLHDAWNSVSDLGGSEWQEVTIAKSRAINSSPYLRLIKRIPDSTRYPFTTSPASDPESDPELPLDEHDPESLYPHLPHQQQQREEQGALIIYSILHSPIYLVPTLYITISPPLPSADSLYDLLVPQLYKASLSNQAIGVLGALSATTHPETGRSCFWVHPCLTQEGMEGVGLKGEDGVEYLMGWIGIVGGSVGLGLPVEVAKAVFQNRNNRDEALG